MSRGKAISVKIATVKVIKALEASLAKLEADYKAQATSETKFEKAKLVWEKEIQDYAIANIKKASNFRTNYRSWNSTLNIDFDVIIAEEKLPKQPERDYVQIHQHEYQNNKEELRNAISMLKMTDEEFINTSTYNAVARYL